MAHGAGAVGSKGRMGQATTAGLDAEAAAKMTVEWQFKSQNSVAKKGGDSID